MKLWIDDVRPAPEGCTWVKSVWDAIEVIKEAEPPIDFYKVVQTMTQLDWDILVSFAKNGMVVSRVAQKLFMHRNTVEYHLQKVKTKTGLDPRNLFQLAELLGIAIAIDHKAGEDK